MAAGRRRNTTPSAFEVLGRDRKLSAADKKSIKLAALAAIDDFLSGAGIKEPAKLSDRRGGRYLPFEDTPTYVCVEELEGDLYLRVESRVIDLPVDHDVLFGLMNQMLETNADIAGVCRLATDDGLVIAAGAENLRALRSPDAVIRHIEQVVEFAEAAAKDLRRALRPTRRPRRPRA